MIKNLRYEKPKHEWDVRVDRTSILGNPFYMQNEYQTYGLMKNETLLFREERSI